MQGFTSETASMRLGRLRRSTRLRAAARAAAAASSYVGHNSLSGWHGRSNPNGAEGKHASWASVLNSLWPWQSEAALIGWKLGAQLFRLESHEEAHPRNAPQISQNRSLMTSRWDAFSSHDSLRMARCSPPARNELDMRGGEAVEEQRGDQPKDQRA